MVRQPDREVTKLTPDVAVATVVAMSLEHVQGTHEMVFDKMAANLPASAFSEENWHAVLSESLVFHACLMNLRAQEVIRDGDLCCSYWVRVDRGLQNFKYAESEELSAHVRRVFADSDFVNDALDCYTRGILSKPDQARIAACSALVGVERKNQLHFSAALLHMRIASALGIGTDNMGFIPMFLAQAAGVKAMWETVIRRLEPVL